MKCPVSPRTIVVGVAATLGALGAGVYYTFQATRRRFRPARLLPQRRPARGYVTRFIITSINRTPNGQVGGLKAFTLEDTGADDILFEDLLQLERLVLYSVDIESQLLVFLRITEGGDLAAQPFLDRGVRKLCDAKDYLYIASFDTARWHLRATRQRLEPQQLLFIWNTGRCGSTLLHRLLLQLGVCSVSEPYWYEQLARYALAADPAEAGHLLELCASLDFPLSARLLLCPPPALPSESPRLYALNGKAFAHSLLEPVVNKWGGARHVFMYRDVVQVVESFQSIFANDVPAWKRWYFLYRGPPAPTPQSCASHALRARLERGELPLPWKRAAAVNALMWIDGLCTWMEVNKRYELSSMVMRMNEFVNEEKRPQVIKAVLRFVLGADGDPTPYFPVFDKHSQSGDRMQRSSSYPGVPKVLNSWDERQIRRLVAAVPEVSQLPEGVLPYTLLCMPQ